MLSVGDIIIVHDRNEIPSALNSTAKQSADFQVLVIKKFLKMSAAIYKYQSAYFA